MLLIRNSCKSKKKIYTYANTLEALNGKVASVWFYRGWSQSFRFATQNANLDKSFIFYGTAPEEEEIYGNVQVPILAFYEWDNERVNLTIEQTEALMNTNGNMFEYEMYDWAGHAFMRNVFSPDASEANISAREKVFERMLEELNN